MIKNNKGVTAIEYALMVALVSIAIIGSVTLTGQKTQSIFCHIGNALSANYDDDCHYIAPGYYNTGYGSSEDGAPLYYQNSGLITSCPASNILDGCLLYQLNEKDPIVNVYGIYDADMNPLTTYDKAISVLQWSPMRHEGLIDPTSGVNYQFEVKTQSGKEYGIIWKGGTDIEYQDMVTGESSTYTGQL